jgi:hypothetical protein
MSDDVRDLSDVIIPKSDQLNAEQLLSGPITVTVCAVKRGNAEQPVVIHYEGDGGRPYKPCKTMRKVLVLAWGKDGTKWVGRSMTLYNEPTVKFGGQTVGGIRISHLSHIDRPLTPQLTITRGKKGECRIEPLVISDPVADAKARLEAAARGGMDSLKAAWGSLDPAVKRTIGGAGGCPDAYKAIAEANEPQDEPEDDAPIFGEDQ